MEDKTQEPAEFTRIQNEQGEKRSLTDLYLASGATGAGLATGKLLVDAAAGKVKDALQKPQDDGPTVVLPPGTKT